MTKTEIQLLSKTQAVEIKAYAVAGTIKERVEWCSQHTDYIKKQTKLLRIRCTKNKNIRCGRSSKRTR